MEGQSMSRPKRRVKSPIRLVSSSPAKKKPNAIMTSPARRQKPLMEAKKGKEEKEGEVLPKKKGGAAAASTELASAQDSSKRPSRASTRQPPKRFRGEEEVEQEEKEKNEEMKLAPPDEEMEMMEKGKEEQEEEEDNDDKMIVTSEEEDGDDGDEEDDDEDGGADEEGDEEEKACKKPRGRPSKANDDEEGDLEGLAVFAAFLKCSLTTTIPAEGDKEAQKKKMDHHLRAREMMPPFRPRQMAKIKVTPIRVRMKRVAEKFKSYRKIRKMAYHSSMSTKLDILKDDQEAQCQCITIYESRQRKPKKGVKKQEAGHGGGGGDHQHQAPGILCNEGCINRSLHIECTPATCRHAAEGKCQNQRLTKRQYKKIKLFKTEGKGWGVKAAEDIAPGELILEYMGEVIDDEEVERRMWEAKAAGLSAYYMVDVGGATVDARDMGNESRFINHGCDPNSEMQKWSVNGELRLGIFAKKKIEKDTEVLYDYQFSNFSEPMECACEAPQCRGILASKPHEKEIAPYTRHAEKFLAELQEAEAFREMIRNKPRVDMASLALFYNGRMSVDELEQAKKARLFITRDSPAHGSKKNLNNTLKDRLQAMHATDPAHYDEDMVKLLQEMGGKAARVKKAAGGQAKTSSSHSSLPKGPYQRRGLFSSRSKRLEQASTMGFAPGLVGEERFKSWTASRWGALADMVDFMEMSKTSGLGYDMNEDICYNCHCSGDLICCESCCSAFHLSCANLFQPPEDEWRCKRCSKRNK